MQLRIFVVVKYMHHGDDLVEHRTGEASFGAQCTNHSANSMCIQERLSVGAFKGFEGIAIYWKCGINNQWLDFV